VKDNRGEVIEQKMPGGKNQGERFDNRSSGSATKGAKNEDGTSRGAGVKRNRSKKDFNLGLELVKRSGENTASAA